MRPVILPAFLTFIAILLLSHAIRARAEEHFSVKEYEEFHDVLHPLEHEALPSGDFKTIRARAGELVRLGEAIVKLGVPAGVRPEYTGDFREGLKKFSAALAKFKADAEGGSDAQLKESYSAVHDSFEMLAAYLPPVRKGS